jgi:RecB family endonuclease NucS
MGSAGLRALLSDQPELLEPGLRVYRDEAGSAAGVSFATGVGEIDLLATDARGNLVAVLVAEKGRGEEELVGDVLQRIGWLRKHLCDGRQQVRAIVLVEEPPASLPYAAAAVADTVVFKTFRVALVFEDVEI